MAFNDIPQFEVTMKDDYPEFEDPETCSWCVEVVEDADLNDLPDGARVCDTCYVTDFLLQPSWGRKGY